MTSAEKRTKIAALYEQAAYLLSPLRRTGPSVHEARDAAEGLRLEAEHLSEELFWEESAKWRLTYLRPSC